MVGAGRCSASIDPGTELLAKRPHARWRDRRGAARELAGSSVPVIVAVSCNAGTFARDAKLLIDGGYRMTAVTPVDQFRYSAHVEIVALLTR
jgi:hypothetical protein